MSTTAGTSAPRREWEYAVSVFAGCVSGVCSTCITNPLDTIRVRLSASRGATGKPHKSLLYTVRDLFGMGVGHAFSRGLGANMMASLPSNGIYLPSYRFLQEEMAQLGVDERIRPALCAIGAVCTTNLTLAPLFLVRTRVQVDDRMTVREVFRDVMRREGFVGFYRGTVTNIGGRFVEEGLFWSVYELLKRITKEGSFKDSNSFLLTSAAMVSLTMVSKLVAVGVAYPYNVVITHLRTVNLVTRQCEHTRFFPTIRHIYQADGVVGFYKGLSPHLLRSIISKAAQIYAFEIVMYAYMCFNARAKYAAVLSSNSATATSPMAVSEAD
ncbi:putative mitochondrial carrier protein [Trypanosoma cruzi]|uniref:Mitochondrial carrier protein, putative n=2 Tax=Trypanosoma cruzi TaxID=5693 RepID=Q4DEN8_TRYCC|nr:mitochondrial carrier protein, putative [Trypanosoma cruzi]EAN90995.1 mitochondrial carrier protein, putative [Trypanosoma cruzi]PWV03531.1 putative mitochondrial carrier protein [Trypanosoma cruzi]|eukprot:XP_812846.1 mitochondrial carrier protein [Trypanosoma cruzi strain CL Brener]